MNDGIILRDPEDRYGRIMPVADCKFAGRPIVGYAIRMEDGFFAITHRDECTRFDSKQEAIEFIARKWRTS